MRWRAHIAHNLEHNAKENDASHWPKAFIVRPSNRPQIIVALESSIAVRGLSFTRL